MNRVYKKIPSPVGLLTLVAGAEGLVAIQWEGNADPRIRPEAMREVAQHPVLDEAERQLAAYFDGQLKEFTAKLEFCGTDFQKNVWQTLLSIPYGETRSYAQIAEQIGQPKAVRAVGGANGRNLIPIIVPCHRVIGANGKLTGFTGGLGIKTQLLELEAQHSGQRLV